MEALTGSKDVDPAVQAGVHSMNPLHDRFEAPAGHVDVPVEAGLWP